MSLFFFDAATTEVTNSGSEVPAATMVNPMIFSEIPIFKAMFSAPVTTILPPATKSPKPRAINDQIFKLVKGTA